MNTFYLICFGLGTAMSVLAVFSGGLHLGHLHLGHWHAGGHAGGHAHGAGGTSFFNGFTLPAFLLWLGAAGFLLEHYSAMVSLLVLLIAVSAGLVGAGLIYVVLARVMMPAERVLLAEDTRMDGVVARVSDAIRDGDGIGEILYSQMGARRSAAARSEHGLPIARGTEVVVLRYERGVAYVSPLGELSSDLSPHLESGG